MSGRGLILVTGAGGGSAGVGLGNKVVALLRDRSCTVRAPDTLIPRLVASELSSAAPKYCDAHGITTLSK